MKRRIFAAVLSAAMILSLAACGGGNGSGSSASDPGNGSDVSAIAPGGSSSDASSPDASTPDASTPDASTPDGSAGGSGSASSSEGAGSSSAAGDSSKPEKAALTLNKTSVKLTKAGATFNLRYTLEPDTGAKVTFTSSDEKIITVNSKGVITAVAPGKAGVTAQCDGTDPVIVSVECDWKEEDGSSSTGSAKITLNPSSITLNTAGSTARITCTVEPKTSKKPSYSSDNTQVAIVSNDGTVTGVAPGSAVITVTCGDATATVPVTCSWTNGGGSTTPSKKVDLASFYSTVTGKYQFAFMTAADSATLDNFYAGLSGLSLTQSLVYMCGMSPSPNGDFTLVQVSDSKDVDTVKSILQARVDYMVGDGNGPGGAFYPMEQTTWEENARIAVNGNYLMLIVHENCDDIVKEFNALF